MGVSCELKPWTFVARTEEETKLKYPIEKHHLFFQQEFSFQQTQHQLTNQTKIS